MMKGRTQSLKRCPYFHPTESELYQELLTDDSGSGGYCYCYGYGTGYLRVATVQELKEFCLRDLHVHCPVYNWLQENGRLSLARTHHGTMPGA
jgi:hypothetical protein